MKYINTIWATLFCVATVMNSWNHFILGTNTANFFFITVVIGIAVAILNGLIYIDQN